MSQLFTNPAQLMSTWAHAITDSDPHLLGDVFTDDAEFVNLFGSIWGGRAAIIDGHAWALAGPLKDSTMQFESIDVRSIGEEVVVMRGVCRRGRRENASADTLAPGTTVLVMVARHGHDGWRTVTGANIAQQAPPA